MAMQDVFAAAALPPAQAQRRTANSSIYNFVHKWRKLICMSIYQIPYVCKTSAETSQ
jgi:hypothetical protein